MAIIAEDSFDRADDITLGTADTGQVWSQSVSPSCSFGIASAKAEFSAPSVLGAAAGQGWLDCGTEDAVVKVTLANVESLPNFAAYVGLTARRESTDRLYRLIVRRFNSTSIFLNFEVVLGSGAFNSIHSEALIPENDDTIALALCGGDWSILHNDVELASGNNATFNVHGAGFGLATSQGTIPAIYIQQFEDFSVTTNGDCTPTYDCDAGACVDPGDGSGEFATLAACLEDCEVPVSYDCEDEECVDPGDGTGEFPTLAACVESGCATTDHTINTVRFDAGIGSSYYVVPSIVDSGEEMRSKTVKPARVTSKRTNQTLQIYGYDVADAISVADLEDGQNSSTGVLTLTDSSQVSQSPLVPLNVPNAVAHTIRVAGDDSGNETRDRIDEIVYQVAEHGVRR